MSINQVTSSKSFATCSYGLTLIIGFLIASNSAQAAERAFDDVIAKATTELKCVSPRITPADPGFGRLYGCIAGLTETVKFFINETPASTTLLNVRFLWNDWFNDIGYGLHADRAEAIRFVEAFSNLYAPEIGNELKNAFFNSQNMSFSTSDFTIEYTYERGPAIDERMLVATPK